MTWEVQQFPLPLSGTAVLTLPVNSDVLCARYACGTLALFVKVSTDGAPVGRSRTFSMVPSHAKIADDRAIHIDTAIIGDHSWNVIHIFEVP